MKGKMMRWIDLRTAKERLDYLKSLHTPGIIAAIEKPLEAEGEGRVITREELEALLAEEG